MPLHLFTLAAAILAALNFAKEGSYQEPTDRVWWVEAAGGLKAQRVLKDGPGQRAGIKAGDLLIAAGDAPTPRMAALVRKWFDVGVYRRIDYSLIRSGVPINASVILEPADRGLFQGMRLIGLVYLAIGLYVLFRRWTAWRSTHFYVFCLVSFVFYSFNSTGKLDNFDWTIYWGKIFAQALQPALFLHFALAFTEHRPARREWHCLHLPAHGCHHHLATCRRVALVGDRHSEDSSRPGGDGLSGRLLSAGGGGFLSQLPAAGEPLQRQQLKWLTRGTLLTAVPLTLLNVIPYLAGVPVPGIVNSITVICWCFCR